MGMTKCNIAARWLPLQIPVKVVRGIATECCDSQEEAAEDEQQPARCVEITFGQHRGQELGSLPDGYLRVLARMARSKWALLAEEVLNERGDGSSYGKKSSFNAAMERDAYARLVQDASSIEALDLVRSRIDQSPHRDDIHVKNALILAYSKYGISQAKQVFDSMQYQNVQSWNLLISAYAHNGHLVGAKNIFDTMPSRNAISWLKLLKGYGYFGAPALARSVYERIPMRNGAAGLLMMDIYLFNKREISEAKLVFDSMMERDVSTCNLLLRAFVEDGEMKDVEAMYGRMPEWDVATVNIMLQAYITHWRFRDAEQLFNEFPERDEQTVATMIKAYCASGQPDEAKALFDRLPRKDGELWHSLIGAYSWTGRIEATKAMFDMIPQRSDHSWAILTEAYAQHLQLEDAEIAFDKIPEWSARCWTAIISAYALNGQQQMARIMFNRFPHSSSAVWNTFIAGLVLLGCGRDAIEVFSDMNLEGLQPEEATFLSVLRACSIEGLADKAYELFAVMVADFNLNPWKDHYSAVAEALGRSKLLEDAEELVNVMPFEPDFATWTALFNACRCHRDLKRGLRVARQLMLMEPTNPSTYLLLAETYAAVGKTDKVAVIQNLMVNQGAKRQVTDRSWVLIKNKFHGFIVGDSGHPQSYQIHARLQELMKSIEEASYVADTRLVMDDGEATEDVKKEMLRDHSEKLAVAFGLMNTKGRASLRIVSNLRVCRDCHSAIKLISKVTGREIVLRDETRFHHFAQGRCSCKDYW